MLNNKVTLSYKVVTITEWLVLYQLGEDLPGIPTMVLVTG